ncbi:MAG: hypothetical protein AAF340_04850 [Pseudomonadota bacterium]
MGDLVLTKTRIQAGVYEGVLTCNDTPASAPRLIAHFGDEEISGVTLTPDPEFAGGYSVRLELPPKILTEGVQTIVVSEAVSGETLDRFSVLTGEPIDDDLRGEVDLLRAELDMLKRAFRRHCLETGA